MTLKKDPVEETKRKEEEKKETIVALIVILVVFALLGWWIWSAVQAPDEQPRVTVPIGSSPLQGEINSPVTVVLFSDFECPFCGEFARETFPNIQEYIDSGEVVFVYKHYPLSQIHPNALNAAQAAICAHDQNGFWEYHDVLYENQDALTVDDLLSYAEGLDLDMDVFTPCLTEQLRVNDAFRDKDLGIDLGVTGTPTFFFNGRRVVGDLSAERFAEEVARERGD